MNSPPVALALALALAACGTGGFFDPGTGTLVGQSGGKPLYSSVCEMDQSTIGTTPAFVRDSRPISAWACNEPQAKNTCPAGFDVQDMTQGMREQRTSRLVNGPVVQTRNFMIRRTTITYTCRV